MLDILHFHPNGILAKKFVSPLIEAEKKTGLKSDLINSVYGEFCIPYDLNFKNLFFLPISFFKIIKLINRLQPKAVISHNSKSSLIPLLAAKLCKVDKKIYFNHGVPYLGHRGLNKAILFILELINCILADAIITVSPDMINNLKRLSNKPLCIINNGSACGIDTSIIKKHDRNKFRFKHNFKENDFVVAFIGRNEKRKGYNLIINLWKNHFKGKSFMKLVVYGGSNIKPKNLENLDNVFFMGFSDNIPEVLTGIDCLMLPSQHEGLSYVCIESTLYKCPIIASNIPGIRSVVVNGKNGYLVDDFNTFNYYTTLKKLKSTRIKKSMLEKMSKKISEKYERNEFISHYINYLKKLLPNQSNSN